MAQQSLQDLLKSINKSVSYHEIMDRLGFSKLQAYTAIRQMIKYDEIKFSRIFPRGYTKEVRLYFLNQ